MKWQNSTGCRWILTKHSKHTLRNGFYNVGNVISQRKHRENILNSRVLKYRSSVFYENRFNDALLEMRGLVVDA